MKNMRTSFSWTLMAPVGIGLALALCVLTPARGASNHQGVVKDWSTHHVVFSDPGSRDEAMQNGTYGRWLRIVSDPRYQMQQRERSFVPSPTTAPPSGSESGIPADEHVQSIGNETGVYLAPAGDLDDLAQFPGGVLPRGLAKALIVPPVGPPASRLPGGNFFLNHMKKDWNETVGNNGTAGLGQYPATYSSGGTNCSDFAVYNTGLAGSSSQANLIAFNNLYNSCNGGGAPSTYWAYNTGTSATVATSVALSVDGTQLALVENVPYPVAASGTATANTGVVPTAGTTITVGATTYTWETTVNITVVNQMSTSGITLESEIAQTLYAALTGSRANCPSSNTTCIASTQPANSSVTAAYAGEAVTVTASCGVGTCGNTVIFTQSGATGMTLSPATGTLSGGSGTAGVGGATLVLIRMGSGGTLTAPVTPTAVSASTYGTGCTAPCMTSIQLSGSLISSTTGPTDTYSSPFYDAANHVIYVGDDSGGLHKFTSIFSGTPTETTTGGWPTAVNTNASLGGPIYDAGSTHVFVGDYLFSPASACEPSNGPSPCGYLYSINSSTGATIAKSAELDYSFGIVDAPVVDPVDGEVYAFAGADNSTSCSNGPCSAVYQLAAGFSGGAAGTKAQVGPGYEFMMAGSFDNAYYTTNTGHLYVIGNTGPANNALYQIPITAGIMGTTPVTGPALATNYTNGYYAAGLQVTEFFNNNSGNHDYIFLSVLAFGADTTAIPCPSQSLSMGCIMGFDVTSGSISSGTVATGVLAESGGTSGIVVDNEALGASNIYFSTLLNATCTGGTGGCAVQTTQAAP